MTKRTWLIFLFVCAVVFAVLELYALRNGGVTLSQVVWWAYDRAPVIGVAAAFSAGFVAGHWFWPRKGVS